MRHIFAIARRELRSYFVSPIAYVALTAYALMSGYFFNSMVVYYVRQADLADRQVQQLGRSPLQLDVPTMILEQFFRNQGSFVLLLILPLLTMGLLTDERRKGTLELLLTSPVRPIELTLGKFAGALTFFAVMCLTTVPYFYFLAQGGDWEPGVVVAGFLGLVLLAAAQIAIGLFVSSLTENMLVSAICTYGVLVALNFVDTSASVAQSIWVDFIQFLSFFSHYSEFARGVVAVRDVTYFAGFLTLGLFLTQRSIEAVRFRRG
jgi:ABC-2 type transport system permease protein